MSAPGTVFVRTVLGLEAGHRPPLSLAALPESLRRRLGELSAGAGLECGPGQNPTAQLSRAHFWFSRDHWLVTVVARLRASEGVTPEALATALKRAVADTGAGLQETSFELLEHRVARLVAGEAAPAVASWSLPEALDGYVLVETLASPSTETAPPTGSCVSRQPASPAPARREAQQAPTPGERPSPAILPAPSQETTMPPPSPGNAPGTRVKNNIPVGAPTTGTAFLASLQSLGQAERERVFERALLSGQLAPGLRTLLPLTVNTPAHSLTYWVMPDVLAVGSDTDPFRVPLQPGTAQRIADAWGMLLPTPKIVDQLNQAASLRLIPKPLTPGRNGVPNAGRPSTALYAVSNQRIQAELARVRAQGAPNGIVTGAKKHVVLADLRPGQVYIYGWYYPTLEMAKRALGARQEHAYIQSLSDVHSASYVDYSHGIQLVDSSVLLDGRVTTLQEVLRDPAVASLVNRGGVLRRLRYA